jgi:hypothetical protein
MVTIEPAGLPVVVYLLFAGTSVGTQLSALDSRSGCEGECKLLTGRPNTICLASGTTSRANYAKLPAPPVDWAL